MKLDVTPDFDPNYLATVVKCPEPNPHPSADRLEILTIFGNDIVVAKGCYTPGETLLYFPVESCVANKYLAYASLYANSGLNRDTTKKGYFESKGRVRAIKLRNVASQGFLVPVGDIAACYGVDTNLFHVGKDFNMIGTEVIATKYVKGSSGGPNVPKVKHTRNNLLDKLIQPFPKAIRIPLYKVINAIRDRNDKDIVDGVFKFHGKTEHLGRNIHAITPDTEIVISSKLHGTSAIYGKILCKKKGLLSWFDKVKTEYKFVYSSRSIIKNKKHDGFTEDVWGVIAKDLVNRIPEGYTVYGEIVGFTPTGKCIQKNYDYRVAPGQCKFYVYRLTYEVGGTVFEQEWEEIEEFCEDYGLETVPVLYDGYADRLFPEIKTDSNWHENFLAALKEKYLDKKCELCINDVINEGIVLRDQFGNGVFKFKSPLFNIHESAERDAGESNMEDDA